MSEEQTKAPRTKAYAAARHERTTIEAMAVINRDLDAAREKTRRLRALREAQQHDIATPAKRKTRSA